MRHRAHGLLQDQALFGHGQVDAAIAQLAGEAEVIALGIEAEQREAEAVLAAGRAVAAAGVAAGPHEDGHDVERKLIGRATATSCTASGVAADCPSYWA